MANYFEAGQWLESHTDPESHTDKETVIITRKPYLTYLYNDRVAEPFLWTSDEKAWIPFIEDNGINYIVEDAFTWSDVTDRFLRPVLRAQSSEFELVFETSLPVTRVWRYHSID